MLAVIINYMHKNLKLNEHYRSLKFLNFFENFVTEYYTFFVKKIFVETNVELYFFFRKINKQKIF